MTHEQNRSPLAAGSVDPLELLRPLAILLVQTIDSCLSSRRYRPAEPPAATTQLASKLTVQIVKDLLVAKQEDGVSQRYLETMSSHLKRFAAGFPTNIGSITSAQIDEWLRGQGIGPRSRNNMRASILTLFRFARKQGYLPKGQPTEADEIAKAKDRGGPIGILRPEQLALLLARASEQPRLFFALGAFTGMRSSEIVRLDWGEVNFPRAFITVAAEKAKTATRRLVPIHPNLMEWLEPYRGRIGRLFKSQYDIDRCIAFAKGLQIDWPHNALRHSYATYRLALIANAARVALEMGNSPSKLMTNYRELADEQEAKAWFSICPPPRPTKVISLKAR